MANVSDRELAVQTLLAKGPIYQNLWDFYEGRQPLVYSFDRMREIFKNLNARFTQNWCAVVIDACNDKIQLQRITVADNAAATKDLAKLLSNTQLVLESNDVHLAALVTGESYVIVWPDEETGEPEAYYNDPCNVHLFYMADKPREKRFGAKWWIGDDNHRYLTLYYPDRLEYYRSTDAVRTYNENGTYSTNEVTNGKAFVKTGDAANEYGLIPVFHFRREHYSICSELQNIIEPQNAVNKLLADMMIAAEFGAFPQRYIISNADNVAKQKNAPGKIWDIPAGDGEGQPTSVGQFDATTLEGYLAAIEKWVTSIAIISRTPKHFFFNQGGDPSGESLIAQEAPLNRKAQKYIDHFIATWSDVAQFMAQLAGMKLESDAIAPIFDKPQTVQPYTQALIRKESVAAGVPLMWEMKQEGYTEQELQELEDARSEEQQKQQETLAAAMTNAQRNFDRGGVNNNAARNSGTKPPQGSNGQSA